MTDDEHDSFDLFSEPGSDNESSDDDMRALSSEDDTDETLPTHLFTPASQSTTMANTLATPSRTTISRNASLPSVYTSSPLKTPLKKSESTGGINNLRNGKTVDKVLHVLRAMDNVGIDFATFLDALSWGDQECIKNATVRSARTQLMSSKVLPQILRRWWLPPRAEGTTGGSRSVGGRDAMENFATQCMTSLAKAEMRELSSLFESSTAQSEDITEEELTGVVLSTESQKASESAPKLWSILSGTFSSRQDEESKRASVILIILSMLAYTRNRTSNRYQKLFAVYFKFHGITAKAFDALHALGLTMSHKWTCTAVNRMSKQAMKEVVELKDQHPWILSYDNVTLPFKVYSQRLDNQSEFGVGTAATVYIKRSATSLPRSVNAEFQRQRRQGLLNPITPLEVYDLAHTAAHKISTQMKHEILQILLDDPAFDFPTYPYRSSSEFTKREPVNELPIGPENITLQYLLGTVNIPEASYEDNSRLIKEWLHQLGLDTPTNVKKLSFEQVIAWVGDQLTVDRLRKLFKFRAEDLNAYDRLEWVLLIFGWLHLMMAFANTLHKQHMGSSRARGLSHAFDLLGKRGLATSSIQGPFYHDLDEVIHHMVIAHIREVWCIVGKVKTLHELRLHTPAELEALASKIFTTFASTEELSRLEAIPEKKQDDFYRNSVLWIRDALHYVILDKAIKNGDVGLMEAFLPHLLFRFVGAGSKNYTIEVLELLQALHREWPEPIKDFVRHNCWLVNFAGKRSSHLPIDMAQEHNIRKVKVNFRSSGPSIDWNYLKKLHPAIHIIDTVSTHVEKELKTSARGKKHATPKADLDITALREAYRGSSIHQFQSGRKLDLDTDRVADVITEGAEAVALGKTLQQWIDGRSFERATTQDFKESSDGED